jgi:hypothetical protein
MEVTFPPERVMTGMMEFLIEMRLVDAGWFWQGKTVAKA